MLLVTTDFTDSSKAALRFAAHLARTFQTDVTVLHVEEADRHMQNMLPTFEEVVRDPDPRVREFWENATGTAAGHYLSKTGAPAATIADAAKELDADIVVCGPTQHRGPAAAIWGSTVRQLVRRADSTVLLVPGEAPQIDSVLVPVDYSLCSAAALQEGARFADRLGVPLTVLHCGPLTYLDAHVTGFPVPVAPAVNWAVQEEQKLRKWVASELGRDYDGVRIVCDRPVAGILDACDARTLLCIGTHGRSGLSRVFMGSTTEAVLKGARVPVLVVQQPANASQRAGKAHA